MSEFLKKEQAEDLQSNGWELIKNASGTAWFGSDWDEGWLGNVTDLLPDIPDGENGMDFLIVAYRSTPNTDEETE